MANIIIGAKIHQSEIKVENRQYNLEQAAKLKEKKPNEIVDQNDEYNIVGDSSVV